MYKVKSMQKQRPSFLKKLIAATMTGAILMGSFTIPISKVDAATSKTVNSKASIKTSVENKYMITKNAITGVKKGVPYDIQRGARVKVKITSTFNQKTKKSTIIKREVKANGENVVVKGSDLTKIKYKNPNTLEKKVVTLVNKERKKRKLPLLTLDKSITYTAYFKSRDMAQLNYFSHDGGSYGIWSNLLISNTGNNVHYLGENIAFGQTTPNKVMKAWMNSKGHRANILNKHYKSIGVGVYYDKSEHRYYWTQHFLTR